MDGYRKFTTWTIFRQNGSGKFIGEVNFLVEMYCILSQLMKLVIKNKYITTPLVTYHVKTLPVTSHSNLGPLCLEESCISPRWPLKASINVRRISTVSCKFIRLKVIHKVRDHVDVSYATGGHSGRLVAITADVS